MSEAGSFSADSGSSGLRLELPSREQDEFGVAVVALDTAGRFVWWGPQAEELFGYSAQEVLGQHAAQLLVHDPDMDLVARQCEQMMETGQSWAGIFPVRNKDGSTRLVEFRYNRLPDKQGDFYALGIATDASTLRKAEQDLALSTQLIAQSPIALEVLDTDLRYVAVNPAMERIHGLSAKDHLGRGFREVLPSDSVDASEAAVSEVLETGRPHGRPGTPLAAPRPTLTTIMPGLSPSTGWRIPAVRFSVSPPRWWMSPIGTARSQRRPRPGSAWPRSPRAPPASVPPWTWNRPPASWPTSQCPSSPTSRP